MSSICYYMTVCIIILAFIGYKVNGKTLAILIILLGICIAIVTIKYKHETFIDTHSNDKYGIERIIFKENIVPNARVVVSFTTIPGRVKFVPDVIKKLETQTLTPDMIYACIPYISRRKKIPYKVPSNWNFGPKVKIVRCEDFGPATKLLGCIPYENDPNTMIITIDDDHTYHPTTVELNVAYAMKYPDACMSRQAMDSKREPINCPSNLNLRNPLVKYLEGFGSPLYRRKYITSQMINYFKDLSDECFVSDDLTISTWLNMQNVPLIKLCDTEKADIDNEIDKIDALHDDNRENVYEKCGEEMKHLEYVREFIWVKSYFYMSDKFALLTTDQLAKFDKNNFKNIKKGDIICIPTYHLPEFINQIFINLKVPIILVTTNADEIIPSDIWKGINYSLDPPGNQNLESPILKFEDLLSDPRIIHWYSSNLEDRFRHEKLSPLPLGIDYHTQMNDISPYQQELMLSLIQQSLPSVNQRPLKVYANFHRHNTSKRFKNIIGDDRDSIYQKLKDNENIYFESEIIPRNEAWKNHGKYSFVLSPHGNGLDCHRTWEALILGCIVIVKSSPINSVYEDLPVVIISDWSEITQPNLEKWKYDLSFANFNLEKLTSKYWEKQFRSH